MAAYTTIDNPELYFQCDTYTGNGNNNHAQTFEGDENMQPDMVWIKGRNVAENHHIFDSVRGANKRILANTTGAEFDDASNLQSFDSDGYTLGTADGINKNTSLFVAWAWKAGTSFTNDASSTSVGNTDSNGSASSTAGFSIAKWEGAGASLDIQVKHGLSVKPAVMLVKNIEEAGGNSWAVYHHKNTSAPETDYLKLDANTATTDQAEVWHDTEPTSAVFTAGDFSGSNRSGDDFVGYFWNEIQGFSKFGSYTGNGNADGPFIHLGFQPAVVFTKRTDSSGNWNVFDNRRTGATKGSTLGKANPMEQLLHPDLSNAEVNVSDGGHTIDGLATGFKIRSSSAISNTDGGTYIYMAFAAAPLTNSNGVPCNAM